MATNTNTNKDVINRNDRMSLAAQEGREGRGRRMELGWIGLDWNGLKKKMYLFEIEMK